MVEGIHRDIIFLASLVVGAIAGGRSVDCVIKRIRGEEVSNVETGVSMAVFIAVFVIVYFFGYEK